MHEITHYILDGDIFSFHVNGIANQFTNAALLDSHDLKYKLRIPWKGLENERYMIYGNGNFRVIKDNLVHDIAYIILVRTNDNTMHVIQSTDFWRDLILDD